MPYRLKGILKSPNGQPLSGVDLQFIAQQTLTPVLQQTDHNIRLGLDGSYDVSLEFNTYAVKAQVGCFGSQHMGYISVYDDTVAGQDLPTLLEQGNLTPATPEYIIQIQGWLAESKASADSAAESALNASKSESLVESDRAEVASNKNIVVSAQADVTSKRNDVTAKAAQVAANTATVNEKTPLAVAAANTATQKAASASTDAATASDAASRAETAAQAMTGAVLDGGQCNLSSGFYPPALTVGGKKYSTVWYVQVGGTVSGITYDAGDVLRYTTANNAYFKVDAVDTATAQINAHAEKVGAHPMSGVAGLEAALADKADVSSVFEAAPLPDVWIPFNDSLRMITGFCDYDRVYIGDEYLELNSRSASFQRATTATYIDKSGVLRTAAINDPRFEKQGLLIEGQRTNLTFPSERWAASSQAAAPWVHSPADTYGFITVSGSGSSTGTEGSYKDFIIPKVDASYTFSLDIAKSESLNVQIKAFGVGGEITGGVNISITPAGASGAGASSVRDAGNYWRVEVTRTFTGNTRLFRIYPFGANVGASGGMGYRRTQLEESTVATSYIPTTTAAVTRAADKVTIPRLNNDCAEWYSGADKITPTLTADTIEFLPPAGKRHIRNLKGFFTPLTEAQKKGLK